MNILMLTNTYKPHVGGVARSVEAFAEEFRRRGHRVLIVAPQFETPVADETDVIRVPAIQKFNGSDFAVRLPIPGLVDAALADFHPDVVHSNHPFLLGDTAARIAAGYNAPLVFQHHTMYERYTHYVPGDSAILQQFIVELSTEYANLCDHVVAPSESVAAILQERGVTVPVSVVPTGVDVARFAAGDGPGFRRKHEIPEDAFVVGHIGRLAPEKNLGFLAEAVSRFLKKNHQAHFLIGGSGPSEEEVRRICDKRKLSDRLHLVGVCTGQDLIDAYHAMDVFAFASYTETQGMVLTEAMAAGCPVVALDAPGAREVVNDMQNGRLLDGQRRREFAAALAWVARLDSAARESLRQNARQTADQFSMKRSADRLLAVYQSALEARATAGLSSRDESLWEAAARRFGAEWDLWAATANAARTALQSRHAWKVPILGPMLTALRSTRRWLSRNEWAVRLAGASRSSGTATDPGVILLQIDGLSRLEFDRAMNRGRLPFLRRLLRREHYHLHNFYSGVPSSTPAVQGELFYGVKTAVPSFGFRDHETGQPAYMFDPGPAAKVQKRLAHRGRGLVEGGSAWSDIYSGGSGEPHFCPAAMGWGDVARTLNPITLAVLFVLHFWSFVRIGGLLVLEFFLAVVDMFRGLIGGHNLLKELKFVPTRVGISILLRELVTIGASMDAARGLPIIHVNLLGYDEQAHRRGPSSRFAHWSLSGIDGAVKRIWRAAHRSGRRDYQVWIYSDHGQESTIPYPNLTGVSIQQAVARVFDVPTDSNHKAHEAQRGEQLQRLSWLGGGWLRRVLFGRTPSPDPEAEKGRQTVEVIAMGPLGHVYPPETLSADQRETLARRLVDEAAIPLVLAADGTDEALAWNAKGRFRLPKDAASVLGAAHEFLDEATRDLVAVCHHPDAGQFVISGWSVDRPAISFPHENGSHGGPGRDETRGFALLPRSVRLPDRQRTYLRPLDLRYAAFRVLGRTVAPAPLRRHRRTRRHTLRILTYNVHSCIGMDGKISPARVARLIAQYDPDVVALQEVDVMRPRTGDVDQAHAIARELKMEFHFHPALQVEEEQYGDAVLSRYPLRLVHAGPLPMVSERFLREPRGAMWVAIDFHGREVHLLNTHLGLAARERAAQVESLLGKEWLSDPRFLEPRIVCGDFNSFPRSKMYRRLCTALCDAQANLRHHRPRRTFPSRYPFGRIDHVFVGCSVKVVGIEVPTSQLARVASDHLPVLVEVRLV